jgi:hypothetical protein
MISIREKIVDLIPVNSIGCELGVFDGQFSEILLASNKFKHLYLVDPFDGLIMSGDKNGDNVRYINGNDLYNIVSNKFVNNLSVTIIKDFSHSFLNQQQDGSLDFVYIDTSHRYEDTKSELEISWQKVKNGGIISGHDYSLESFPGVVKALDEFLLKYNISDCIFTETDRLKSYLFYKN